MSRARLFDTVLDATGRPIVGATVNVYQPNTTTPISETLYADDTGGTTVANPLMTGADGSVLAYLDVGRRVDLNISAAGMTTRTVPDVGVEPDPALSKVSGSVAGPGGGGNTTSTTYVDLPDMSVTLTISSGVLIAMFQGTFSENTLGAFVFGAFSLDGAAEVGVQVFAQPVVNALVVLGLVYRWSGLSIGSHTVKVRWKIDVGTGTASGTRRNLVVMEG